MLVVIRCSTASSMWSVFPGRSRTMNCDVGQRTIQPSPILTAMSLVVQLCHNVSCIHGICRDAGGMNVIRMAGAVRVIRDDHLRPITFDELWGLADSAWPELAALLAGIDMSA